MPPSLRFGGAQSSKRLVDESDASFSFQIPTALGDDCLLEYDDDFFKGADDILATPAPSSRFTLEPLTINDLTPRPSNTTRTSLKASPQKIRSRSLVMAPLGTPPRTSSRTQHGRPKPNKLTQISNDKPALQTPAGERIESLRAQVHSLIDDLEDAQEPVQNQPDSPKPPAVFKKQNLHRREAAIQRKDPAKNTVFTGGITKARHSRGVKRSSIASTAATALAQRAAESRKNLPTPEAISNPDFNVGSDAPEDVATVSRSVQPNPKILISPKPISAENSNFNTLANFDHIRQETNELVIEPVIAPAVLDASPLTLSQLSPQKRTSRGLVAVHEERGAAIEGSPPLRTSSKRPVSVERSDEIGGGRTRKKGKLSAPGEGGDPSPSTSKDATAAPFAKRLSSTSRKPIRRLSSSSSRLKASIKEKKARAKTAVVVRSGSSGRSGSTRSGKDKEREAGSNPTRTFKNSDEGTASNQFQNRTESSRDRDRWGKIKSTSSSSSRAPHPFTTEHAPTRSKLNSASGSGSIKSKVNIPHATIPIGFNFRVNARLEARKGGDVVGESEKAKGKGTKDHDLRHHHQPRQPHQQLQQSKPHTLKASSSKSSLRRSSIPDFKSLHASHEADLAARRERLLESRTQHAIVPVPMNFRTEARLRERHKFDERIKEKEKRDEEEREARRRQREEEEERELRELRKKAIPKAHEVPEWYRDAPKRQRL